MCGEHYTLSLEILLYRFGSLAQSSNVQRGMMPRVCSALQLSTEFGFKIICMLTHLYMYCQIRDTCEHPYEI